MVGWSDVPADLSDTAKIARVSDALPKDIPIVSSDLFRAVATADAIAEGRTRRAHDKNLREMNFGAWELRKFDDIERDDPERAAAFWSNPGVVRPPGGESWHDLERRVNGAVDTLLARGQDMIVVAHFGAILTQIQRIEGLTAEEAFAHRIEPLSITQLRYGPSPKAVLINHQP